MRLKLDETLPRSAKDVLEQFDHDCTTVVDEGLGGATDAQVAGAAAHEGRMLVTLDRGFGDNPRLLQRFLMTTDFADLERCTVIVEDNRVRVRHPRAE